VLADVNEVPVPTLVQQVIERRLTQLGEEAQGGDPAAVEAFTSAVSAIDLRSSDYLLEGMHFASADVYTSGYYVAMVFPALVIVMCVVSRLRNRDGFRAALADEQG
jgi:hypothetical protein